MATECLLLHTLEDLLLDDFKKLKWYLSMNVLDGCKPIPKSRLEDASRMETVSDMINSYGEDLAVNITVEILKKMNNNNAAEKLRKAYAAEGTASATATSNSASAPPASPVSISAQDGSVVIAPIVSSGTSGTWNLTVNK